MMQIISGMIERGNIKLNHPIPAEDGTAVIVLVLPKAVESNITQSLFGKWGWYTQDIQQEVQGAWQRWAAEANPF